MLASVRAGVITPRDSGLKWPVAAWKSPRITANAPSNVPVPGPIPPYAFVDYASEAIAANGGFSVGDYVRLQRARIGGGNNFIHPYWDATKNTLVLSTGNGTNYLYFNNKSTQANFAGTAASWRHRLYGAWPLSRNLGNIIGASDGRKNLTRSRTPGVRILRRAWASPWVRTYGASPFVKTFDTRRIGLGDEPMFIQLWGRSFSPENGYKYRDQVLFLGNDGGGAAANGGEVWYNQGIVGFGVAAGHSMLSSDGTSLTAADPTKWEYQLRAVWAGDGEDILEPRNAQVSGLVSMYYGKWETVRGAGQRFSWTLPANFTPADIGVSLRMRPQAVGAGGWQDRDELYSRNAGYASNSFVPTILVRGQEVIIQLATASCSPWAKSGAGATTVLSPIFELQIRAIGS